MSDAEINRVGGTSTMNDFTLAAESCLPILSAVLVEIKNKTYPQKCFLNVDLPTNVLNHKGYKLTKQGSSMYKMGWKQVTSDTAGGHMLSTMTMEPIPITSSTDHQAVTQDQISFRRVIKGAPVDDGETDYVSVKEGYITVTPLGAFSHADMDSHTFFKEWLPAVAERASSAL
uniref:Survival protein SurE-like phosphatase/nucleotidase n=1 Tax=Tanacetum cinerariifolium TaxID=118510 RepID=A0A6L2NVY2_TANCI|nr:survival protein SurE-like phosphatase/nucleotidase [Tanacetum cinerariifolium]